MTADFADATTIGNIGGEISDFEVNGKALTGDPTLKLDTARLFEGSSSFNGETEMMNFGGNDYEGRWGGQFYNDPTAADVAVQADRHPGNVARDVRAATEDNMNSFIGWFNADLEEVPATQ